MCGRYVSVTSRADLQTLYGIDKPGDELRPNYNVAPTQEIYAVIDRGRDLDHRPGGAPEARSAGDVERQLRTVRWGLIPAWAKDAAIGSKLINARVETLASKPAWRRAYRARRAIIPADGYYEWQRVEHDGQVRKQPYFIHRPGGAVLSLAGLYELWPDPRKDADDPSRWVWSATIITTDATGALGEVHNRTPVIVPADRVDAWLDPHLTDPDTIATLTTGIDIGDLLLRPVRPTVNKVSNNGPDLLETLPGADEQPLQLALA